MEGVKKRKRSATQKETEKPANDDFVRGGSSGLTPLEYRKAIQEVNADLFSEDKPKQAKRTKPAKSTDRSSAKDDEDVPFGDGVDRFTEKAPKKVDLLKFKKLSVGMVFIGSVREIGNDDVTLNLPNNLTGFVGLDQLTDELPEGSESVSPSQLVSIGQIVRCVIVGLSKTESNNKRIDCSLRPSLFNAGVTLGHLEPNMLVYASVHSVEDHGYMLNLGMDKVTGFLNKKHTSATYVQGQLIDCIIASVNKGARSVICSAKREDFRKAMAQDQVLDLTAIKPGMLVNATVRKMLPNGLFLSFLGLFTGTVHERDLATPLQKLSEYDGVTKVKARILHVDYTNKMISLTLKSHIVNWSAYEFPVEVSVGSVFDSALIHHVDSTVGLILKLEVEPSPVAALVHVSRLSDTRVDNVEKVYKVGHQLKVRIIALNYLEGCALASAKDSVLNQQVMSFADIIPGQKLSGKVLKVGEYGVLVSITDTVRALVPPIHFADVKISKPASRFKIGSMVQGRVVDVDPGSRKLTLTLKRSLVDSKLPVLTSYTEAQPGQSVVGYVANVAKYGVIVNFYNNIRGILPAQDLAKQGVKQPSETFEKGQVVTVDVVEVKPEEERLRLAVHKEGQQKNQTNGHTETVAEDNGSATVVCTPGDVVKATIVKKDATGLFVRGKNKKWNGFISKEHLSDHSSHYDRFLASYEEGQRLDKCLVLQTPHGAAKAYVLSLKPSLLSANERGQLPKTLGELQPNAELCGYVKSVASFGVFVSFLDRLTGLATKDKLSHSFVSDPEELFEPGQSVRATVVDVDSSNNKFTVSLKGAADANESLTYLNSLFDEQTKLIQDNSDADSVWNRVYVGATVEASVTVKKDYGLIMSIGEDITGIAVAHQSTSDQQKSLRPDDIVKARILDVDRDKNIVDLSLKQYLLDTTTEQADSSKSKKSKKKSSSKTDSTPDRFSIYAASGLKVDQVVDVTVELIKENYLVVSLSGADSIVIGFAAVRDFNQKGKPHQLYKPGQKMKATIKHIPHSQSTHDRLVLTLIAKDTNSLGSAKKRKADAASADVDTKRSKAQQLRSLEQLQVGQRITGKVKSISDQFAHLSLGFSAAGRIHVTEVKDDLSDGPNPFSTFKIGDQVEAVIIAIGSKPADKTKEVSDDNPIVQYQLELSTKPSKLNGQTAVDETYNFDKLKLGQKVHGVVQQVVQDGLWVTLSSSLRGRVFVLQASDDLSVLSNLSGHFKPGQSVSCYVAHIDFERKSLDLSLLKPAKGTKAAGAIKYAVGQKVCGRISKVMPGIGCTVQLSPHVYGRLHICDIADDYPKYPLKPFKENQLIRCAVIHVDQSADGSNKIDLSTRPSLLGSTKGLDSLLGGNSTRVKELNSIADVMIGQVVHGYVKQTTEKGCFIHLSRNLIGRTILKNLSDDFVQDPKASFPAGALVRGKIIEIDSANNRVDLSLKKSVVTSKNTALLTLSDLHEGDHIKGHVKRLETFGVFITLAGSELTGMCHKSEITDDPKGVKDINKMLSVGDPVKVIVLKIDKEKKKISLGMKPSYFTKEELMEDDEEEAEEEEEEEEEESSDAEAMEQDGVQQDAAMDDSDNDEEEDDEEEDDDVPANMEIESRAAVQSRSVPVNQSLMAMEDDVQVGTNSGVASKGFISTSALDGSDNSLSLFNFPSLSGRKHSIDELADDASDGSSDESDDDDEGGEKKKKSKRAKRAAKAREEKELRERETSLMDERPPETADDFEKALLASPHSSYIWIQYMAFQLKMKQVEKAREVAEKALKTISFKEEREKLNVWVALLNLESLHGTPQSLQKVFDRACQFNEPKLVHIQMTDIHDRAGRVREADELYQAMCKRFGQSAKVFVRYALFLFKHKKDEEVKKLLLRALQSLAKRKHLKVISKFALLEFKYGAAERGRTMFEGILSSYPKRTDLWSIYIDMEIKVGNLDITRRLFERCISLRLSSKKMKFFFKRYLEFEKEVGTEETIEHVKQKAREYVESLGKGR